MSGTSVSSWFVTQIYIYKNYIILYKSNKFIMHVFYFRINFWFLSNNWIRNIKYCNSNMVSKILHGDNINFTLKIKHRLPI